MMPLTSSSMGSYLLAVSAILIINCCNFNNLATFANAHKAHDVFRISRGWHTSRKLSLPFISSSLLNNIRGGSTVEEEAVIAADGKDIAASTSDETTPPEVTEEEAEAEGSQPRNLTFTATTANDGSAEDPDGIPTRFLDMKKGDRDGAKEAFEAHLAWREEYNVDTLLERPHPNFDVCKQMAPHYFAGRDPHNNIIFVQRPAHVDFELMRMNNATIDDLLLHYVYIIQYCWNIVEPSPTAIMTNVLDMRGSSFRQMSNSEYIDFGKRFVAMMSSNYPGRSFKTLIINAPTWINVLYKVFKPMLRESTRQKIIILKAGEEQDTALKFYLGDSLPDDLLSGVGSGKDKKDKKEAGTRFYTPVEKKEECTPGPNSEVEFEMREFVSLVFALVCCSCHLSSSFASLFRFLKSIPMLSFVLL
jgi:hypothetical protein